MTAIDPRATLERSRSLADQQCWTIALQARRLGTPEPEDHDFCFRRIADFDFLLISVGRLIRAVSLAKSVPACTDEIETALATFKARVPGWKRMRDVGEHIDEYGLDAGRDSAVSRKALQVQEWDDDAFRWLGEEIRASVVLDAARDLYGALKGAIERYELPG